MRRPVTWAGIALVNLSAMTLFLWHQTAFITVSSVGLLAGRVPGLLTAPTGGLWVAERSPGYRCSRSCCQACGWRSAGWSAASRIRPEAAGTGPDLGQPQVGHQPRPAAAGQADEGAAGQANEGRL